MRLSRAFLPTLKETPAEAQIASHRLMLRAGLIRQTSAGIYAWLPAGLRVLRRVEQIVTNLIDNAAKFSPDGAPVTVRVEGRSNGVLLSVVDRGIGIAPSELPRLFDRFYQSKRARERIDRFDRVELGHLLLGEAKRAVVVAQVVHESNAHRSYPARGLRSRPTVPSGSV